MKWIGRITAYLCLCAVGLVAAAWWPSAAAYIAALLGVAIALDFYPRFRAERLKRPEA